MADNQTQPLFDSDDFQEVHPAGLKAPAKKPAFDAAAKPPVPSKAEKLAAKAQLLAKISEVYPSLMLSLSQKYEKVPPFILAEIVDAKLRPLKSEPILDIPKDQQRFRFALRHIENAIANFFDTGNWRISTQMALDHLPPPMRILRNMATHLLRSALFTCRANKIKREACDGKVIAKTGDGWIRYTGVELRQNDASLLMEVVQVIQKTKRLEFDISAYALLKALGLEDTGPNRNTLHQIIMRLKSGVLDVYYFELGNGEGQNILSVAKYVGDGKERRYRLGMHAEILELFRAEQVSRIDIEQRRALGRNYLAMWLHGYISTHKEPVPVRLSKLKEACGSSTKDLHRFRQLFKEALKAVENVGALAKWDIQGDMVYMFRPQPHPADEAKV